MRATTKSASRLFDRAVIKRLSQLARLFRQERQGKLRQGDLLIELIDHHGCRPIDIARAIGHRANELSQMYWVAKTFPAATRPTDFTYNHMLMAMRVSRRFRRVHLQPLSVLKEIGQRGFTQHRQVTAHFAARIRQRENLRALQKSGAATPQSGFNRCYHARFQTLLNGFSDKSIKVLHADVPYANYRHVADGRYAGGRTVTDEADSATAVEALATTVDLLRDWQPKIATGGVLLLWQASGPLRAEIATAVQEFNWDVEAVAVWDKDNIQPGHFASPYSTQCEWLWILKRRGDRLINHDNSPRGDVLRFAPANASDDLLLHTFQKPEHLMKFLVGKHSYAGELVFDCCGCTGSMSVAAMALGRRWIYCESHGENFELGSARIARAHSSSIKRAG